MIINPHSDTRPCAPNCLCAFQRWLQRRLSSVEASIIEPLERLRSKNASSGSPTRIYIDTTDQTAIVTSPNLLNERSADPRQLPPLPKGKPAARATTHISISIQSYVTDVATTANTADEPLSRVLAKAPTQTFNR